MSRSNRHHGRGSRSQRLAQEIEFYLQTRTELLERTKLAETLDEKRELWIKAENCKALVAKFQKQLRSLKSRCKPTPEAPLFTVNGKEVK